MPFFVSEIPRARYLHPAEICAGCATCTAKAQLGRPSWPARSSQPSSAIHRLISARPRRRGSRRRDRRSADRSAEFERSVHDRCWEWPRPPRLRNPGHLRRGCRGASCFTPMPQSGLVPLANFYSAVDTSPGCPDEPAVLPLDASGTDGALGVVPDSERQTHRNLNQCQRRGLGIMPRTAQDRSCIQMR
jgi:hypothetical protein